MLFIHLLYLKPALAALALNHLSWRLKEAVAAPDWLDFKLEHRMRWESLFNDPRTHLRRPSNGFSLRTLGFLEVRRGPLVLGLELQDSRMFASEGVLINNTMTNPFDVLQAYGQLNFSSNTYQLKWSFGRQTMDIGSRRLVARNAFRNTINAFTGIDMQYTRLSYSIMLLRVFVLLPVQRFPMDDTGLQQQQLSPDRENINALMLGAFYESTPLFKDIKIQALVLGYLEKEASFRRLANVSMRFYRPAKEGVFFDVEGILQVGRSHASSVSTDKQDLMHLAGMLHASLGYQFKTHLKPRMAVLYDYASGDNDPQDKINGRFDPLFGARRFELGPTSLYGLLSRSNLHALGARLEITTHERVELMIAYRPAFLSSVKDAWVGIGLRDVNGQSGSFLGHQIEGLMRIQLWRQNVRLELGAAYFNLGHFVQQVSKEKMFSPVYLYSQLTVGI